MTDKLVAPHIPYRCPICGGRGFVDAGFYMSSPMTGSAGMTSTAYETCRSCDGKGVLWEPS